MSRPPATETPFYLSKSHVSLVLWFEIVGEYFSIEVFGTPHSVHRRCCLAASFPGSYRWVIS